MVGAMKAAPQTAQFRARRTMGSMRARVKMCTFSGQAWVR